VVVGAARVERAPPGQNLLVEETTNPATTAPGEPDVGLVLDGDTARLTLTGELTDAARRPLVRVLTQLLLERPTLHRVELDLRGVSFMNSAGMAVLVQGQRMAKPRGIEVVLVDPAVAVSRPLQLSGLWHRFPIEHAEGHAES
jgi:stage II sporulation protein AA (anti-sigma F factor antagonist)